jgi:hypothetical protein
MDPFFGGLSSKKRQKNGGNRIRGKRSAIFGKQNKKVQNPPSSLLPPQESKGQVSVLHGEQRRRRRKKDVLDFAHDSLRAPAIDSARALEHDAITFYTFF